MPNGTVTAICIAPEAGEELKTIDEVYAEAGMGLVGDRYHGGAGSWNKGKPGHRQVTLINGIFFERTEFKYADARRNFITHDIELMDLIGQMFTVGAVTFQGVRYCDPCQRPSKLAGITDSFRKVFFDRGGLIADVVSSGIIKTGDAVTKLKPRKDGMIPWTGGDRPVAPDAIVAVEVQSGIPRAPVRAKQWPQVCWRHRPPDDPKSGWNIIAFRVVG